MANTLIPIEERSLTPGEVEVLDRRRRRASCSSSSRSNASSSSRWCCSGPGRTRPTRPAGRAPWSTGTPSCSSWRSSSPSRGSTCAAARTSFSATNPGSHCFCQAMNGKLDKTATVSASVSAICRANFSSEATVGDRSATKSSLRHKVRSLLRSPQPRYR